MRRMIPVFIAMMLLNSLEAASQAGLAEKQDSVKNTLSLRILPQNFYTTTLSFTCKKEFQLQKLTRLPVFIRLGSKEYVDYLEGKGRRTQVYLPALTFAAEQKKHETFSPITYTDRL